MERRYLTPEFIDRLVPPTRGDRWIADTSLRGFGVRLWAGKTRGKSFAIRVRGKDGQTIREAILPAESRWLQYARERAEDRIQKIKGREPTPTFRERMQQKWQPRLRKMSFDDLAKLAIEIQRRTVKSTQYVDDNWSRYNSFAAQELGKRKAHTVTAEDMFGVIKLLDHKPAQKRNLHSFFTYMLNLAWTLSPDFRVAAVGLQRGDLISYQKKEYYYDNKLKLETKDFRELFKILKREKVHVQKAYFIHLMFLLGSDVSPRKLLQARTEEFFITKPITFRDFWNDNKKETHTYVYWKPHFVKKKYFSYRLQDDEIDVLRKIFRYNQKIFPDSPFLFPSLRSAKSGHMTSFIDYWHQIKSKTGLPDMPLRKLVGNYMWAKNRHFKLLDPETL
jgi:hypothetical protein